MAVRFRWLSKLLLWCSVVVVLPGCGSNDEGNNPKSLAPVTGAITLDGQPLSKGVVSFVPDKTNPLRVPATSPVDSGGGFKIVTNGRPGAPLGRYRVCVSLDPAEIEAQARENRAPEIPLKYRDANTTPLIVDVVSRPSAGAYDFKLTTAK